MISFSSRWRVSPLIGLLVVGFGRCASAQEAPAPSRRVTVQVHYGANGHFFASSFRDTPYELQHVDFLGTAGGTEVACRVGKAGAVALGYTRSVNQQEKHLRYQTNWGSVEQLDFRLRFIDNAFQAIYEHALTADFKAHAGLLYLTTASQTASPVPGAAGQLPAVVISETNRGNSYAEEAGVVAGLEYSRPIDTRLRLGLKVRAYYLVSVTTFEMLTLTPTLSYRL